MIPQGDRQAGVTVYTEPTTYHVQPIPDSDLIFGFAVPTKDEAFELPTLPEPSTEYFQHHMRMYSQEYRDELVERDLILTTETAQSSAPTPPPPPAPASYAAKFSQLDVEFTGNDRYYPALYISREHATYKLGPNSHCDVFRYTNNINDPAIFDELERYVQTAARNTTAAFADCPVGFFEIGAAEDVRLLQAVESEWRDGGGTYAIGDTIIWKYVGTASGVSFFFPGHRLPHSYDPRTRPWYHQAYDIKSRAVPTVVSSPYLDISGSGKVVTVASTVFDSKSTIPAGSETPCTSYLDCCEADGECRLACYNDNGPCLDEGEVGCTCSASSVHAVVAADVPYSAFHGLVGSMVPACAGGDGTTRCFVIDASARLVYDKDILAAADGATRNYERISLARRDGGIMRMLVSLGIFESVTHVDYQGTCSSTLPFDRLSVKGLREGLPPRDADVHDKYRGPHPRHDFEYTCVKDVVSYELVRGALEDGEVASASISNNPCLQGTQEVKVTPVPDTNLLLVVAWNREEKSTAMPFGCHIYKRALDAGSFQIVNGTCGALVTEEEPTLSELELCPSVRPIDLPCSFNSASVSLPPLSLFAVTLFSFLLSLAVTRL